MLIFGVLGLTLVLGLTTSVPLLVTLSGIGAHALYSRSAAKLPQLQAAVTPFLGSCGTTTPASKEDGCRCNPFFSSPIFSRGLLPSSNAGCSPLGLL
jgi:hypothetical protein